MIRQLQSGADIAATTYFASNLDGESNTLLVILAVLLIIMVAFFVLFW